MNEIGNLINGYLPFGIGFGDAVELIIYLLVGILILGIAILSRVCILLKNQEKQMKGNNKDSRSITLL